MSDPTLFDTQPEVTQRRSEDIALSPGECQTWVLLDDATVDALANGICPEALAQRMWRLKGPEREHERVRAADRHDDPDAVLLAARQAKATS